MPHLEVQHDDGRVERHDLGLDTQLLVGRHAPADIVVTGGGRDVVYCRFMRKKNGCEATSVAEEGIEFLGQRVRKAKLNPGDTVRVGHARFTWIGDKDQPATPTTFVKANVAPPPVAAASPAVRPPPSPVSDDEILYDVATISESQPEIAVAPEPVLDPLRQAMFGLKRPGEQEVIKSPLVMGLGIGTVVLLLMAATLYFILGRESAQRQWNVARSAREAGQYPEAIAAFEQFQASYPRDARVPESRVAIAQARVEQKLSSSIPDWDGGLKQLDEYVKQYRDTREFQDAQSPLRKFAAETGMKIGLGAAKSAGQTAKRELLKSSEEGQRVLERYSAEKLDEQVQQLEQARAEALKAIIKQETYTAALVKIDQALKSDKTLQGLREYGLLLQKYAEFATNKPLRDRLKATLLREQKLTPREPATVDALHAERAGAGPPALAFVRRTRDRSDRSSVGETVLAMADESIYGLDSVTGEPLFRRVIGNDPGFFPVPVAVTTPGWLVCDARHQELALLERRDGALHWRQALAAAPAGPPLIHEGQIYLALSNKQFVQLDLASGRLTAKLTFTQKVGGQPVLSASGERIYLFGHESLLYVLTRRPLACERAVYLGHGPGAIVAPMVPLRNYLLVPENDQVNSCRLRLFKANPEDQPPVEIDSERVQGHVYEQCIIRGKDLFVPSAPERVTAFSVSETDDDKALARIADQQVPSAAPSRMYLAAGPDGQLWMASTGLRKFQLTKTSLLREGPTLATGAVSQPMQTLGDALYVARRLRHSRAVYVTEAERQRMVGEWQAAVGGAVLACTSGPETGPLCVTSAGDVFRMSPEKLASGGLELQSVGSLVSDEVSKPVTDKPAEPPAAADQPIDNKGAKKAPAPAQKPAPRAAAADPLQPLRATRLTDGSVAVWRGGPVPKLFHVGGATPVRTQPLTEALEADPIQLAGGWMLPLSGKLRLAFRTGKPVHDWIAEIGAGRTSRWRWLLRVDDKYAIAVNSLGRVSRVQVTETDPPHVAEVSHWDAGVPIDSPVVLTPAGIVLVDIEGRRVLLDSSSLEPLESQNLPLKGVRLFSADARLFQESEGEVVCFDAVAGVRELKPVWKLPLSRTRLAGPPIQRNDETLIALEDGLVLFLDAAGAEKRRLNLDITLGMGPTLTANRVIVGAVDGSVYQVSK